MSTDRTKLKEDFAENLLRHPDDPFKAAFLTTPDTGLALQIGRDWPNDPIVKAAQQRLISSTEGKRFLPTKEEQAREVYKLATSDRVSGDERLKAHRLYAELMGFIEKPVSGNTTNILNQGVMIVREAASDEDWEAKAIEQQRVLTAHATVN